MKTFRFDFSSGGWVEYQRVHPSLFRAAMDAIEAPSPPMVDVPDITDPVGERTISQPNYADPDYIRALTEYQAERGRVVNQLMLSRGVLPLDDERRAEVARLRDDMAKLGVALDDDDMMVYLFRLCADADDTEIINLTRCIQGLSIVSEVAISKAIDEFQPDV